MKDLIKKYWWTIIMVLVLPVIVNFVLLIPIVTPIVGDNTMWLSFWGGYLGSIISAGGAFVVLHIQRKDNYKQNKENKLDNENQNEANRNLQLNVMNYQQQSRWLDNFINASLEYCHAFNNNDIILISNVMWDAPDDAFNMIKVLFDRIGATNAKFSFQRKQDNKANELAKYVDEQFFVYCQFLNDLQWVVLYFKSTTPILRNKSNFISYLKYHFNKKNDIGHILQITEKQAENMSVGDNRGFFYNLFHALNVGVDKIKPNVRDKIYEYIKDEQLRIDGILIDKK